MPLLGSCAWSGTGSAAPWPSFVGTFALVFVGAGAIAVAPVAETGLVGVALAFGLAVAVMASAVGHISGAHFNPAVTFGFVVTRRMAPVLALVYWAAQLVGATLGALLLHALLRDERSPRACPSSQRASAWAPASSSRWC